MRVSRRSLVSLGVSLAAHVTVLTAALALAPRTPPPPRERAATTIRIVAAKPPPLTADIAEPLDVVPAPTPDVVEVAEPRLPEAAPLTEHPFVEPWSLEAEVLPPIRVLREVALPAFHTASLSAASSRTRRERPATVPANLSPPPPAPRPPPPIAPLPTDHVATRPLVPVQSPRYYPPEALRAGLQGRARVRIRVGGDGRVEHAYLATSSGHALLDQAALASARRWRFRPPGTTREAVLPFTFEVP